MIEENIPEIIEMANKFDIDINQIIIDRVRYEVDKKKNQLFLENIAKFRKNIQDYMKEEREDPEFELMCNDAESLIGGYNNAWNRDDNEELMAIKFEMRRYPSIHDKFDEYEQFVLQNPERFLKIIKTTKDDVDLKEKILISSNKLRENIEIFD